MKKHGWILPVLALAILLLMQFPDLAASNGDFLQTQPMQRKTTVPPPKPIVSSANPASIRLLPGGKAEIVTIQGKSLGQAASVQVLLNGNPAQGVTAKLLQPVTATELRVEFGALSSAQSGSVYLIRVIAGNTRVDIPTGIFTLEVILQGEGTSAASTKQTKKTTRVQTQPLAPKSSTAAKKALGRKALLASYQSSPNVTMRPLTGVGDPQIKAIGDRVAGEVLLAMDKTAANLSDPQKYPLPTDPQTIENIFARRLQQLPEPRRRAASAAALRSLQGDTARRARRYGVASGLDPSSATPIAVQARTLGSPTLKLDPDSLSRALNPSARKVAGSTNRGTEQFVPNFTVTGYQPGESSLMPPRITPILQYSNALMQRQSTVLDPLYFGDINWRYAGVGGYVLANQEPGTVPLHRYLYSVSPLFPTFYASRCEIEANLNPMEMSQYGNKDVVLGYVRKESARGFVPLHRYRHTSGVGTNSTWLYAYSYLARSSMDDWYASQGFYYDGICCYVPNPGLGNVDTVELRVSAVICRDETDNFSMNYGVAGAATQFGKDEIRLKGTIIPGIGTNILPKIECGSFNTGDQVQREPAEKAWATYYLDGNTTYPFTWLASLVLAEIDQGGLGEFTEDLLDAIVAQVIQYAASAASTEVATLTGAMIGTALFPGVGTAIGAGVGLIVGVTVGYICNKVWEELKAAWKDEIFPPQFIQFTLDKAEAVGGNYNTVGNYEFTGFGAQYSVVIDWRVYKR